jgi:preprotein translocase subunit SecG
MLNHSGGLLILSRKKVEMETLLIIVHIVVCLFLIGIVLLQHGKGADIGATFGGSSQSLFGSEGPLPLLNKITTFVAVLFMVTSISLAYISANRGSGSVMSVLSSDQPAAVEPAKQEAELVVPAEQETVNTVEQTAQPVQEEKPAQ